VSKSLRRSTGGGSAPATQQSEVWLVGIRTCSKSGRPDFYTIIYSLDDIAITRNGPIVLFEDARLSKRAVRLVPVGVPGRGVPLKRVTFTYDLSKAFEVLLRDTVDHETQLLECLNFLFDRAKQLSIPIPRDLYGRMAEFADHLTFDKDFSPLVRANEASRETVRNGLLWCLGLLFSRTSILRGTVPTRKKARRRARPRTGSSRS